MMKKFILIVCGSFVGSFLAFLIFTLCALAISFSLLFSMSSSMKPSIKDKSVLYLKLDGNVAEYEGANQMGIMDLIQGREKTPSLNTMIKALHVAETEDKIKGVLIDCNGASASTATLRQLRQAIAEFKKNSRKWVYAYANEGYEQGDYYVASVADSVLLNPIGAVDVHGLVTVTPYFKKVLDKVGVEMQIMRVGTYKSAVEPYMLDSISPANREQQTLFLGNLWKTMAGEIAASRHIDATAFNAMVDNVMLAQPAEYLLAKHLIDATAFKHQLEDRLKVKLGIDDDDDLRVASPEALAGNYDNGSNEDGIVAVVYAVGEIDGSSSPASESGIDSEELVNTILDLKKDDDVKGLVLRVNSPGGSAFGSEQIWEALEEFKKSGKTFAVSMGDYAASGGYYISSGAHRIFADETTITGSIGIFGVIPCAEELVQNKLGINTSIVKTNANSDMGAAGIMSKKLTPVQMAAMQNYVNRGYDLFTKRCATGRKVSQDSIKKIAEGRVWDGITAKKIGLVDEFGGLDKAIEWVAKKANLNDGYYQVQEYPNDELDVLKFMKLYSTQLYAKEMQDQMGLFYQYFEQTRAILNRDHVLCLMEPMEIK